MRTKRLLVLAFLFPLVGCGGGGSASPTTATTSTPSPSATPSVRPDLTGLSAVRLSAKARAALQIAESLRVHGVLIGEDGTLAADVSYGRTGTTANMVVEGHRIQVVLIGKVGYLKASDSYWRATNGKEGKTVAALMSGRWLKGKLTDKPFRDFADMATPSVFVDSITDDDWPQRPAKTGVKTVNGVSCIGLVTADNTFWIDKYTAQLVRFEGSKDKSRLNFSQFNAAREPVAPPASMVIDWSVLV